jgi:rhodanese-related sulfurtransferase
MRLSSILSVLVAGFLLTSCGNGQNEAAESDHDDNDTLAQSDITDDEGLVPEERRAPIELDPDGDMEFEAVEAQRINPNDAYKLIQGNEIHIVDVRTDVDFAGRRIPGANNADFTRIRFIREIGQLEKNKPVLLYCGDGILSNEAASLVSLEGFSEIYVLQGGIQNWVQQDLPLE